MLHFYTIIKQLTQILSLKLPAIDWSMDVTPIRHLIAISNLKPWNNSDINRLHYLHQLCMYQLISTKPINLLCSLPFLRTSNQKWTSHRQLMPLQVLLLTSLFPNSYKLAYSLGLWSASKKFKEPVRTALFKHIHHLLIISNTFTHDLQMVFRQGLMFVLNVISWKMFPGFNHFKQHSSCHLDILEPEKTNSW